MPARFPLFYKELDSLTRFVSENIHRAQGTKETAEEERNSRMLTYFSRECGILVSQSLKLDPAREETDREQGSKDRTLAEKNGRLTV